MIITRRQMLQQGGAAALLGDADLVSQDVLIEVVRKLEEQQWMLRAQLGENV